MITNSGGADATGVQATTPTPADTTFVAGSVHASPLAIDDGPYNAVGNTKLYVGVSAPAGEPALAVSGGAVRQRHDHHRHERLRLQYEPVHGAVSVNTNGTFVYTPNAGYTGAEFVHLHDQEQRRRDAHRHRHGVDHRRHARLVHEQFGRGRRQRQVHDAVQFADGRQRRGRLGRQRRGERFIYVYKGSGAYAGGLPLESGQVLTSESNALVVGGNTLRAAVPANVPTLSHNAATTVVLASGNTVDGFIVTNSAGSGIAGVNIGTTAIADIAVTVTGGTALGATTSGTLTVTGSANTLSSTNGPALNVPNVTIGASGLTFQSISDGGGGKGSGRLAQGTARGCATRSQ